MLQPCKNLHIDSLFELEQRLCALGCSATFPHSQCAHNQRAFAVFPASDFTLVHEEGNN